MTNEVKNVPELRFPKFEGEWKERKLNDLLIDNYIIEQSDGNHGELYPKSSEFTDEGIPYLAASNINNNKIDYQNIKYLPLERAKQFKKGVAQDGDILLAHNATVGPTILLKTDRPFVILSTTLTLYRINNNQMDNRFFLNEMRSNNIQNQLKKLMKQTTRNQVPILLQRTMHISYPENLEEQQKIGTFFSKLDLQIELEEQKLEKLEEQKKGYMQKIFSQELRFKDKYGNSYPNWKELNFFDVLDKIIDFRGRTPKKLNMDWSNAGYLALSAVNVKKGYIDYNVEAKYGGKELYKKWMKGNELQKGQVLFTTEAPMGNVAQVPDNKGYILSQRTIAFNTNEKITNDFLASLLSSKKVYNKLLRLSSGATAKGVSQKTLKSLYVTIPISIEEQQKIGEFLKKIDNLINKQFNKVYLLKQRKQGLLQGMFV